MSASGRAAAPVPANQWINAYDSAYLFGAVCPARDTGAALTLPFADTSAMQRQIDEISRQVSPGATAVVLTDNAGWHKAKAHLPANIRPLFIPASCPELNAQENIWQYMRQSWLSNRVFAGYAEIIDAACEAWKWLFGEAGRIASIATRDWALEALAPP